ncbi:MAG: hypothetical protein K5681_02215, partial [Treponema sp.]|nr:hypothetical protein [Treponema sp.]
PVLKKGASEEEKIKRYPRTMLLNSLMIISAGLLMLLSRNLGAGIPFILIGLFTLFFSNKI